MVATIVSSKYYREFTSRRESIRFPRHTCHRSMPLSRAQDDLFESSTMTFGQHLEELRRCLFMAIIGLAIGCGIGLIPAISVPVVKFLSDPVEKALTEYYQTAAENKAKSSEQQKVFREAGYTSDAELARIVEIVTNQRVSAEVVLIDPQHLLGQLQVKPDAKLPAPAEENLAANGGLRKLVLFRPIADRVKKVVEAYAKELNLAVVVNETEDMLFANDVVDITTEIIRRVNADIVKNPTKPK